LDEKLSDDYHWRSFATPGLTACKFPLNGFARILEAKTTGYGKELVQTGVISDLVPYLRQANPVIGLATLVTGLRGNAQFVRQDSTASAQWFGESATVAATNPMFSTVTAKPSRLQRITIESNFLVRSSYSSLDMLAVVVEDLVNGIANELGRVALLGLVAASNQPTGLLLDGSVAIQSFVATPFAFTLGSGS